VLWRVRGFLFSVLSDSHLLFPGFDVCWFSPASFHCHHYAMRVDCNKGCGLADTKIGCWDNDVEDGAGEGNYDDDCDGSLIRTASSAILTSCSTIMMMFLVIILFSAFRALATNAIHQTKACQSHPQRSKKWTRLLHRRRILGIGNIVSHIVFAQWTTGMLFGQPRNDAFRVKSMQTR